MNLRYLLASMLAGISAITGVGEIQVRGRMIDAVSLQPLPGGIVKVEGTTLGTMADSNGVFAVTTDTANYIKLIVIGYEPQILKARHQLGNITMRKEIPAGTEEKVPTSKEIEEWMDTAFGLYNQGKYTEAFDLFQMAVLEGSPIGDYGSGICYINGNGVGVDQFKGAALILSAAMAGLTEAQYTLGIIYRDGIGFRRDIVKAKEWLGRAAERGNERAIKALEEMK